VNTPVFHGWNFGEGIVPVLIHRKGCSVIDAVVQASVFLTLTCVRVEMFDFLNDTKRA